MMRIEITNFSESHFVSILSWSVWITQQLSTSVRSLRRLCYYSGRALSTSTESAICLLPIANDTSSAQTRTHQGVVHLIEMLSDGLRRMLTQARLPQSTLIWFSFFCSCMRVCVCMRIHWNNLLIPACHAHISGSNRLQLNWKIMKINAEICPTA